MQTLADECGYTLSLQEALFQVGQTSSVAEPETRDLRQELFQALITIRGTIYSLSVELDQSARGFSAVAKRLDRSGLDRVQVSLAMADTAITAGDTSTLALDMLAMQLVDAGVWYSTQVERLFDGYQQLVSDDAMAWLEERR
ncbi:hypothetical protein ACI782_05975 [Geodermatophilus sp. SYSU D00703]